MKLQTVFGDITHWENIKKKNFFRKIRLSNYSNEHYVTINLLPRTISQFLQEHFFSRVLPFRTCHDNLNLNANKNNVMH